MPATSAKSLTLFNNLFAIRGVPLLLEPISNAASGSISIPSIFALLVITSASSLFVYRFRLCIIPNLSLIGPDKLPALVVAPI